MKHSPLSTIGALGIVFRDGLDREGMGKHAQVMVFQDHPKADAFIQSSATPFDLWNENCADG